MFEPVQHTGFKLFLDFYIGEEFYILIIKIC